MVLDFFVYLIIFLVISRAPFTIHNSLNQIECLLYNFILKKNISKCYLEESMTRFAHVQRCTVTRCQVLVCINVHVVTCHRYCQLSMNTEPIVIWLCSNFVTFDSWLWKTSSEMLQLIKNILMKIEMELVFRVQNRKSLTNVNWSSEDTWQLTTRESGSQNFCNVF